MTNEIRDNLLVASQAAAFAVLVLYAIGFVVVNAHLAKWGAASFDFANSQYMAAGLLFAVFSTVFWFLVGRRIIAADADYEKLAVLGSSFSQSGLWRLFCHFHVLAEIGFAHIAGAVWIAALFFPRSSTQTLLALALLIYFILDYYLLFQGRLYQRAPHIVLPINSVLNVGILGIAIAYGPSASTWKTVILFFVAAATLNLMHDIRKRLGTGLAFTTAWASLATLTGASAFGSMLYGEIKADIGGGQSRAVTVLLNDSAPETLKLTLATRPDNYTTQIFAETPEWLVLSIGSKSPQVIRVSRSEVAGLLIDRGPDDKELK